MAKQTNKSIKLTPAMRQEILSNILNVFDKKNPKTDTVVLATEVYDYAIERACGVTLYRQARDLMKCRIDNESCIKATTRMIVTFSVMKGKPRRECIPAVIIHPRPSFTNTVTLTEGNLRRVEVQEFLSAHENNANLAATRQKLRNQTVNLLASVNTTKQLLEAWPDAEKYMTPYIRGDRGNTLPAVSVTEINRILGWEEK